MSGARASLPARIGALILAGLCGVAPVGAAPSDTPQQAARQALDQLQQAGDALVEARGKSNRVAALTRTVEAYEASLAALREGLREVEIRRLSLARELDARREEVATLLGVLLSMQQAPETLLLLHPSGPLSAVRSGMLLGEITPALNDQAETLRADLNELAVLGALQETVIDTLDEGLAGALAARTELAQAISQRVTLPGRFAEDADAMRLLVESTDSMDSFAAGLTRMARLDDARPVETFEGRKGHLPLPVAGRVLRAFGESDAAGVARPGLVLATRPRSLVTAPAAATIRYLGPLLDFGNVIVLEPQRTYLIVLAGLAEVYGQVGQVIAQGAPVGLMGGTEPTVASFLAETAEGGGEARPETLYMELRHSNAPVDPAAWFSLSKD